MAKRYYRPELDALRFFAFASVFCDHLPIQAQWFQPLREAGAFGMCMFFMLSAYLIITILLREKETAGTVNLRAFAVRRILRIWPLYFLVLFGAYALGHFFHGSATVPRRAVLAFSFLCGNLYILHHGWLGPVGPLWSLSVEEQFYVLIPAIFRLGGRRGIVAIGIAAISLAYVVLLRLGDHGAPSRVIWVNSFVQFQFFAAGGFMALWLYGRSVALSLKQRAAIAMVGLVLWFEGGKLFPLQTLAAARPVPLITAFLLVLLGTFLIFISILDIEVRIPRPLVYLGKISYGLYLLSLSPIFPLADLQHGLPLAAHDVLPEPEAVRHHASLRSHRSQRRSLLPLLRTPHPQVQRTLRDHPHPPRLIPNPCSLIPALSFSSAGCPIHDASFAAWVGYRAAPGRSAAQRSPERSRTG